MDSRSVISRIEASLAEQLTLAGGDTMVAAAGEALGAALRPAMERAVLDLAEQAALEVGAQLPDHEVEVVFREGDPHLVVRTETTGVTFDAEDLDARMTVRLPPQLKSDLERAARSAGDSINAYVIRTLAAKGMAAKTGKRVTGTFDT